MNNVQGQAVSFHLAPEQSRGEGQREMRSARLARRACDAMQRNLDWLLGQWGV